MVHLVTTMKKVRFLFEEEKAPKSPPSSSLGPTMPFTPEPPVVPVPLPVGCPPLTPQAWHKYDEATKAWKPVSDLPSMEEYTTWSPTNAAATTTNQEKEKEKETDQQRFHLTTWNADAFARHPEMRMKALLRNIWDASPKSDIVFLQEVCVEAARWIMHDDTVRKDWFISEDSVRVYQVQRYATMTLVSKRTFGYAKSHAEEGKSLLGPVWRTRFRTRYMRDGLCCDLFVAGLRSTPTETSEKDGGGSSTAAQTPKPRLKRLRLINVHLDSLPSKPSFRPSQLEVSAALLRAAGAGLVAGDFNPVQKEDQTLLEQPHINLLDAWKAVRPGEDGFTWGTEGPQPYPPARLDKIAMLGLRPLVVEVVEAGTYELEGGKKREREEEDEDYEAGLGSKVPTKKFLWSDHHGLRCQFALDE